MPSVILSSDTFTAFGPGTVGAAEITYDFGAGRLAHFQYEMAVASVTGFTTVQVGFQWSPDVTIPAPVWTLGIAENMLPPITAPFTFQGFDENRITPSIDSSGRARNIRAFLFLFGTGSASVVVTIFDGVDVVVEDGSGVTAANVYLPVGDALARLTELCPSSSCFAALAAERQDAVWVESTRRLEKQVERCVDGAALSQDPDVQLLLFLRTLAHDSRGRSIDGLPPAAYVDGHLLFAEELACAELAGEDIEDPSLLAGVTSIKVAPDKADFEVDYASPGHPGGFFTGPGRRRIWDLLSTAWPLRRRG